MSRPHRARLATNRLPLRRRAGALSAWLHMPMPEHNPAPPPLPPPPPTPQGPEPDAPEVIDPPLPGERAPQIEPDRPAPMQSGGGIEWHHPPAARTGASMRITESTSGSTPPSAKSHTCREALVLEAASSQV